MSSSCGVPAGRSDSSAALFSRSCSVYAVPARSVLSSGSPVSPIADRAGLATVTLSGAACEPTESIGPSGDPAWVTWAADSTVEVVTQYCTRGVVALFQPATSSEFSDTGTQHRVRVVRRGVDAAADVVERRPSVVVVEGPPQRAVAQLEVAQ